MFSIATNIDIGRRWNGCGSISGGGVIMLIFVQFTCCCSACFAIGHRGRTDPAFRVSSSSSSGTGRSAHCSPHCYRLEYSNVCSPNDFVNILKYSRTSSSYSFFSCKGSLSVFFLSVFISRQSSVAGDESKWPAKNKQKIQAWDEDRVELVWPTQWSQRD